MQRKNMCCQSELAFGMLTDSPNIYYMPIEDIEGKVINLPYADPECTIQQLMAEYRIHFKVKEGVCFMVRQGPKKGQIAQIQCKLDVFELDQTKICFRVVDKNSHSYKLLVKEEQDEQILLAPLITIIVQYNNQKFQMEIRASKTILSLKKQIVDKVDPLTTKTADKLKIMHKGLMLTEDKKTLQKCQIQNKDILQVMIKKESKGQYEKDFFVKVRLAEQTQKIQLKLSDSFMLIKQKIEAMYYINTHNQKLSYAGQTLLDQNTIIDKNIHKGTTIFMEFKNNDLFNFVKEGTPVLLSNGQFVPVEDIVVGERITTVQIQDGQLKKGGETVEKVDVRNFNDYMVLNIGSFDSKDELVVSSDAYLELVSGQVINVKDLCYKYDLDQLRQKRVKNVKGLPLKILGIAHETEFQSKFYKINTVNSTNMVTKHCILHHNVVNILFMAGEKRIRKISLPSQAQTTISKIKLKLIEIKPEYYSDLGKVVIEQVPFTLDGQILNDKMTIDQANIKNYQTIFAQCDPSVLQSKLSKSSNIFNTPPILVDKDQIVIEIRISNSESYTIRYVEYKNRTIQMLIKEIYPGNTASYFFVFSNLILFPTDGLDKLEEAEEFHCRSEVTLIMIKNQKLAFLNKMKIKKEEIKNHSCILVNNPINVTNNLVSNISKIAMGTFEDFMCTEEVVAASDRIFKDKKIERLSFKKQQFFNPFLFVTSRKYNEHMFRYIKYFQKYKEEYHKHESVFNVIKDLYLNIQLLEHFYGNCFFGVKNFRFSRYFKKDHTFYLYNFLIAYQNQTQVLEELEQNKGFGTFFHVRSLNGRDIHSFSLYPELKEILFAPFTCFLVQKVTKTEAYDEVYLVQLSSPISFKKDIILWVDDQPQNNQKQIKQIYNTLDIEILQATSTLQAQKWIQQFGWLLKWKGLKFKLISDMVRIEGVEMEKHDKAGIQLLVRLYKKYGVTVKTLIYCNDVDRAYKLVLEADLSAQNIFFHITKKRSQLYDFIKDKRFFLPKGKKK